MWLDLIHGVNYLPAIALLVAIEVIQALRLSSCNTSLTVVNSDPLYPATETTKPCSEHDLLRLGLNIVKNIGVPTELPSEESVKNLRNFRP